MDRGAVEPEPGRAARSRVLRSPPTPAHVDPRTVIIAFTAAWIVAAIGLAISWSWLSRSDHEQWLWTAIAGALLGIAGLALMSRHHHQGRV